ncbi:hypothetical protein GCK32_008367, partial [Trichostrongylus colubriformis]
MKSSYRLYSVLALLSNTHCSIWRIEGEKVVSIHSAHSNYYPKINQITLKIAELIQTSESFRML